MIKNRQDCKFLSKEALNRIRWFFELRKPIEDRLRKEGLGHACDWDRLKQFPFDHLIRLDEITDESETLMIEAADPDLAIIDRRLDI